MKKLSKFTLATNLMLSMALAFFGCAIMPPSKIQPGDTLTDSRDGKTYKTVIIGNQTWIAQNLDYAAQGSKCYENNPVNCQKFGRLYDWNLAMESCPEGWHLPSNAEWDELYRYVDGTKGAESPYLSETAGRLLKTTRIWGYDGGIDEYGFTALPGGMGTDDGEFGNVGKAGSWWSSSESNASNAYNRMMVTNDRAAWANFEKSSFLFSVRCLKNLTVDEIKTTVVEEKATEQVEAVTQESKSSFTDSRDNKTYKTVKIGTQTWMSENLDYNASESKCYDNKPENCKYGRLYDWATAMKSCPAGWHLPSNAEWDKLYSHADGSSSAESPYKSKTAGKLLKTVNGWNESGNGTDILGFSAMPGGGYIRDGFINIGGYGYWWVSSEYSANESYGRFVDYDADDARWSYHDKSSLLSVRCIQD